ncbi:MAG: hypothetical protein ACQGVK_19695 [Myxococcota bacterium]
MRDDEPSSPDRVRFDVLLRAPGSGREASVGTIADHRVDPDAIERCRRVLADRGVTCHPTDFGLVCDASKVVFEGTFGVELARSAEGHTGRPAWAMLGVPAPPESIADLVDQITIAAEPELFG